MLDQWSLTTQSKTEIYSLLLAVDYQLKSMFDDYSSLDVYGGGAAKLSLRPARRGSQAIINPMDINDSFLQSSTTKFQVFHYDALLMNSSSLELKGNV